MFKLPTQPLVKELLDRKLRDKMPKTGKFENQPKFKLGLKLPKQPSLLPSL